MVTRRYDIEDVEERFHRFETFLHRLSALRVVKCRSGRVVE